ncbi:MAG TPA: hypothetical protein VMH85_06030 [Terriglobales bacterium]|nr:hypothetical protein [Terriglobales bacterium]
MSLQFRLTFPRFLFAFSALAIIALAGSTLAPAQEASRYMKANLKAGSDDMANARGYINVGFNPDIMSVPGRPFTATRVYSERHVLPGASASADSVPSVEVTIARDRMGRVHYESTTAQGGPIGVMIYDPVAHTIAEYSMTSDRGMPDDAVAKITKLTLATDMMGPVAQPDESTDETDAVGSTGLQAPPPVKYVTTAAPAVAPKLPAPSDLPERSIHGVPALGYRTVQKYGDRQQSFMIQEDWFSPQYAINVRQDVLRQNTLESTVETRDVVPGDPDPDLFRVPGGYVVTK